ncbi:unnamed protein product [Bursaphelenchus okinawaensis]|uniref:G_PROTEIN_RECEP_F1_2 domain-containing protein n=1 Tax=Bursaphelenchus okinawaensis TaxID=465554 RepID=A0A811K279_9BILA|nr:unnamed protein product [Bursaphelenchus okinawaensis]CAG9089319.1 unnamed protein product [Bursaphelenchus okinawaensis]
MLDYGESAGFKHLVFGNVSGCNIDDPHLPTFSLFDRGKKSLQTRELISKCGLLFNALCLIYFGIVTWKNMRKQLEFLSTNTKRLIVNFNLVLTLQALLPLLFTILPSVVYLAHNQPTSWKKVSATVAFVGSISSPTLDALIVLFVMPSFRRRVVSYFPIKTTSNVTTVVHLDSFRTTF